MTAAGYVGIEPEAAGWLAGAAERTGEEVGSTARRVAALLAEAGEQDTVSAGLRELESWLNGQAADVRRRAALAAVVPVNGADPTCQVPWTDPLVRVAKAVWHNAARFGSGAATSVGETATMVWQLVPVNDGWGRAWIDLGHGVATAVMHPSTVVEGFVDMETLEEEGFSYWIGGRLPDVAAIAFGGAGAGKVAVRAGDKLADVARTARRRRREVADVDVPAYAGPVGRRNPVVELRARHLALREDKIAGGHTSARHGRTTTLPQQEVRAATGLTPDGLQQRPMNASRFFRWKDQYDAIEQAKAEWKPGMKKHYVDLERPAGEGYMTKTLEYRRTSVIEVRFDPQGRVYTAFPYLKGGGPMP